MIVNAIKRAYQVMQDRQWDTVYWAIDIHGVCFSSSYERGGYAFINDDAVVALQAICARPESRLILWSSCHLDEQADIVAFFAENNIRVDYFNANPEIPNTRTGDFGSKFYFSVLLDDKAGFDPDTGWAEISGHLATLPSFKSASV
jgi:hypothetical protein